jgi:hypothetical protein
MTVNNLNEQAPSKNNFKAIALTHFQNMLIFLTPPSIPLSSFEHFTDKNIIIEGVGGLQCPYFRKAFYQENSLRAAACVTTYTAYYADLIHWLEIVLDKTPVLHPTISAQILTSTHEAIANAILWSNLELENPPDCRRPLEFAESIERQLNQACYAKRRLTLLFSENPKSYEVTISVEGKPILWKISPTLNFRGTNIIKELTDDIVFTDHNQTIRLCFHK